MRRKYPVKEPAEKDQTLLREFTASELKDTNSQKMRRSKKYTAYVTKTTEALQPNRVLGTEPPEGPDAVDSNKEGLEREDQVRVAQLRSGFCPKLND